MQFSETGLSEATLRAVTASGYTTATPIQAKAIPAILTGKDLLGVAQTGTGKTAAFALPTLDRLATSNPHASTKPKVKQSQAKGSRGGRRPSGPPSPIRSLILAPTRELAAQIQASLAKYGKSTGLRYAVIFGGVNQNPQVRKLQAGVDILVATPGRLLDLKNQGYVNLSKVEVLILDEADQMLDMGFLPDLKRIVSAVPKKRQTLMFSATMPKEILRLAEQWLTNPVDVRVTPTATPIESITQSVWHVDQRLKPQLLVHYLVEYPSKRTIVFTRTKHGADKVVKKLDKTGIRAEAIHGNKSQNARTRAIESFKSERPPVLVATDIAARGLDISNVSHVINFDLPEVPETYVHRIGRTGRAGKAGIATSFCAPGERSQLRQIERLTKITIPVEDDHPEYEAPPKPTGGQAAAPRRSARSNGSAGKKSAYGKKTAYGKKPGGKKAPGKKVAGKKKPFTAGSKPATGDKPKYKPKRATPTGATTSEGSSTAPPKKRRPGKRERQAIKESKASGK